MLGYVLTAILIAMLVLLFIPIVFAGQGIVAETVSGQVDVSWAGGLLAACWRMEQHAKADFSLRLAGRSQPRLRSGDRPEKENVVPKSEVVGSRWNSIRPWLDKQVIKEIIWLAQRLWFSLRIRWNVVGEYGAEDPAVTGIIAAIIAMVAADNHNLGLCPCFDREELNLQGEVSGRIIPAFLLWDCARFALSMPIRRIWWTKLGDKIKKNRRRSAYV